MNRDPDVAAAIPGLERDGLLPSEAARAAGRIARGELLSVRAELRAALYAGVLLAIAGLSWFVKENAERIGPVAIAVSGALLAAGLFFWVARRAEPFSWGERASPHLAFDFLLLLAVLVATGDLAYVETQFAALGESWPWHLLLVALGSGALAVRYDSKLLFSLALSTFAAWRGVAIGVQAVDTASDWFGESASTLRVNAIACGAIFIVLAWAMKRFDRKAHFEPATVTFGWILVLAALFSGRFDNFDSSAGAAWAAATLVTGVGLAAWALRQKRFGLFALGVLAGYVGFLGVALPILDDVYLGCSGVFMSSTLVVVGIVLAQRRWFRATLPPPPPPHEEQRP